MRDPVSISGKVIAKPTITIATRHPLTPSP